MKEQLKICPKCGKEIPADAPEGLCVPCVMAGAVGASPTEPVPAKEDAAPSLETVQAAFPQYEILELIGAGGMGAVYRARQPKLDRFVALKILPHSLACNPGFTESFSREARVLARLNHPNIVTVHDFGESNGFFYLVMEHVDGANLRQAMEAGRFSPESALAIVPRICEALQFAHEQGILHRDIKPENILLDARGRVKIADFGIAKLMGDRSGNATLTAEGAVVGTPRYMAPEQLERPREVDHRADIYSLGVVFYEMLTGELPVGRFAPPSQKSAVDPRVDPIVLRSLEKERDRRYRTVAEVKTQVEQITATPPAGSEPELAPRRPKDDFILCNPRLPRFAQAITAYTLLAAPFYWLLGTGIPNEKPPAEPYGALVHALTYAVVQAGDFVAMVLLFIGGLRLRALRRSAPSILRIALWFHLLLLVVGVAGLVAAEVLSPTSSEQEMSFGEAIYTALGTGMIVFEIWALVWLRRNRENLGEVCARTVVKAASAPVGGSGAATVGGKLPVAPGATLSLVFTLLSLPFGLVFLMTALFVLMAPSNMDSWVREHGSAMATGAGIVVVPASLGMLLGIWALQQVRAGRGQVRGLARSLIGALSWPAIACLMLLNSVLAIVTGGFLTGGRDNDIKLLLNAGLALAVCVFVVYRVWRWAREGSAAAGAGRAWLVALIAAGLLIFPALLTATLSSRLRAYRALVAAQESKPLSEGAAPVAGTSTSTPAAALPVPAAEK